MLSRSRIVSVVSVTACMNNQGEWPMTVVPPTSSLGRTMLMVACLPSGRFQYERANPDSIKQAKGGPSGWIAIAPDGYSARAEPLSKRLRLIGPKSERKSTDVDC